MKNFTIPRQLHIGKDNFGRLEATESSFQKIATIKIIQTPGRVLGGCDIDTYLGSLRRRALQAYKDGQSEIEA